jgi:hypothetical protein
MRKEGQSDGNNGQGNEFPHNLTRRQFIRTVLGTASTTIGIQVIGNGDKNGDRVEELAGSGLIVVGSILLVQVAGEIGIFR